MGRNSEEPRIIQTRPKSGVERDMVKSLYKKSETERPNSLIIKKAHRVIPPHIIAEAISNLHGVDLRWSGPITPAEMQYVEQYVVAKYPEYSNALVEGKDKPDLYELCVKEEPSEPSPEDKRKSPRGIFWEPRGNNFHDLVRIQPEPSRLLDILTKKSSYLGSFISIPEIQARNKVLKHCGLREEEYLVLFTSSYRDAMMLVGESYPFFKGNYYMTVMNEERDYIRAFVGYKDSKVVLAPEAWLDLRIKGSQLSQYFRRKSKQSPKGLFCYPANVNGTHYSMHWVSEAHRNSWHVLLDATSMVMGKDRLNLALHRPDFVLCGPENTATQCSMITCLLVRRESFETASVPHAI
ncbi:uncharacterized protein LOC143530680 [Bidens hawaiensis]|uniref:uncharacterized protein LOC143530680 n=1 Tax=Bidens hawaiensis TaxID=980011 RepID=UPI004049A59D